ELRVVGIDEAAQPRDACGLVEQGGQVGVAPRPQRLLQQPEPHHVAQVADLPVDAALVGEVGPAALLGQDGGVQLDPDERPGAAGDVGEPLGRRGDGGDGGGGVVGADGDDPEARVAGFGRDVRADGPDDLPRFAEGRQDARRDAQLLQEFPRPGAVADVQQPGRGRVGALGADLAGEPVAEQVRDQQQGARPGQVVRRELVDRVERQELQARHPVEEVVAEFGADALHHPVGAGVAVVDGVADEAPGGVQEPVVYGPRVHADRDQAGRGAAQAVEDVAVEAENVPVQGAGDPDGTVGEAAQLHQLHGAG